MTTPLDIRHIIMQMTHAERIQQTLQNNPENAQRFIESLSTKQALEHQDQVQQPQQTENLVIKDAPEKKPEGKRSSTGKSPKKEKIKHKSEEEEKETTELIFQEGKYINIKI